LSCRSAWSRYSAVWPSERPVVSSARPDQPAGIELFLEPVALLDTRAPAEFAHGAFPEAHNLPLMDDAQRAAVGTCYRREGQAAAIALGHRLVSGELKAERVASWVEFARRHPQGYLYCFRGGLRSQIVQQWLAEAGIQYPRVLGGYKALRRLLIEELERNSARLRFVLVAGKTGSGKTRLIRELPRAVDLEGLARHRGSTFGALLQPQPSQIDFENALSIALLRLQHAGQGPVILEDEGHLIGRLSLPASLRGRMAEAPLLELEHSLEERVQVVLEDYVMDLGARFRERAGDAGPQQHRQRLQADLARTRKRLGGERYQAVSSAMDAAFEQQWRDNSTEAHRDWIRVLLRDYYDPMYDYQMQQRSGRRLARGSRSVLRDWVASQTAETWA